MNFHILQLLDSAFPIGSFAHSGGLEALYGLTDTGSKRGRDSSIRTPESFTKFDETVSCILENTGMLQVPFIRDVFACDGRIDSLYPLDRQLHLLLSNHVAKRASLQQGKSFAAAVSSTYSRHSKAKYFYNLNGAIEDGKWSGHFAIVFAYVCSLFELDVQATAGCFLFGQLRTIIGSAVRMGLFGPIKAQEIQNDLQSRLPGIIKRGLAVTEPHICYPILEIAQCAHDKMFAKLFYS